jgi:hypothetical protein
MKNNRPEGARDFLFFAAPSNGPIACALSAQKKSGEMITPSREPPF